MQCLQHVSFLSRTGLSLVCPSALLIIAVVNTVYDSLSVSLWSWLHKHRCWLAGNRPQTDSCVMPLYCIWSVCGFISQQQRFYPPWDWGVGHPLVTYYFSHLTGFTRSKGVMLPGVLWLNSVYHSASLTRGRHVYCWPGMTVFVRHNK